jgi:hypothetical protein
MTNPEHEQWPPSQGHFATGDRLIWNGPETHGDVGVAKSGATAKVAHPPYRLGTDYNIVGPWINLQRDRGELTNLPDQCYPMYHCPHLQPISD